MKPSRSCRQLTSRLYKSLPQVEQAFRCRLDLRMRPIHHRTADKDLFALRDKEGVI